MGAWRKVKHDEEYWRRLKRDFAKGSYRFSGAYNSIPAKPLSEETRKLSESIEELEHLNHKDETQ